MNSYRAYRMKGGTYDKTLWQVATVKIHIMANQADKWRELNGGKPLSEAPQYPEILKLERELKL